MRTYLPFVAFALATISFAVDAHADDPRKAQADAIFADGVKLHEQDREAEALEKFKKAYALYPMPNTLMAQARAEHLVGRPLEAIRHYREALKNPLLHPRNAELAKQYVAELETRVARVSVTGPSGTKFSLFGETYRLPLEAPLDVEPGTLLLHGDQDGKVLTGSAFAPAGKLVVLELKGKDSPVAVAPEVIVPPPPVSSERSFWDAGRVAGVASFGVGIAGLAAGASFGASSRDAGDRAEALQKQLGRASCGSAPAPSCAELNDARDTQGRDATLSTVFVVGGSAFAATGLLFFFWPRREAVNVVPSVGRSGASLLLTGAF